MADDNHLQTIAIVNSTQDFLDIMSRFLNAEGYVVVTLSVAQVKSGEVDIVGFIESYNPGVILYDIAFPYEENWRQCEHIRSLEICRGRSFIITTPNIDALQDKVGKQTGAFELVDKETDLRKIVTCVQQVWHNRKVHKSRPESNRSAATG